MSKFDFKAGVNIELFTDKTKSVRDWDKGCGLTNDQVSFETCRSKLDKNFIRGEFDRSSSLLIQVKLDLNSNSKLNSQTHSTQVGRNFKHKSSIEDSSLPLIPQ